MTPPAGLEAASGARGPERDKLDLIAGGEPVGEKEFNVPSGRRGARAAAVQALYESDLTGHPAVPACRRLAEQGRLSTDNSRLAEELARRVEQGRTAFDGRIGSAATEYPAGQLAAVDRNVLRLALAEAEMFPDLSRAVIITEAVELARLFGSDSSPRFVHGVLGALLR